MKVKFLLFIFSFSITTTFAQKQTWYLFAYTQKIDNAVCGSKLLIASEEVSLTADEAPGYKSNYEAGTSGKYNYDKGFKNTYVELVRPTQVAIFYEAQRTHNISEDGDNCTTTYYGCVIAGDFETAESKFASLKSDFKTSVFKEIKRWSKAQISSVKAEDVEVKWVQTKQGIIAYFTNARKDMAFNVQVKAVKKGPGAKEANAEMLMVEQHSLTIQPGEKLTLNFRAADGFNVDAWPVPAADEGEGLIQKGKHLIRQYIADPHKGIQAASVAFGVRG